MSTILVNNIKDTGNNTLLTSDGSGNITLPSGFPAGQNTPAFQATMSANQTISTGVNTKVQFDTESYDTDSDYDVTNYRFTPTTAGKYSVTLYIRSSGSDQTYIRPMVWKNGATAIRLDQRKALTTNENFGITGVVELNGSTDYIEAYVNSNSGTTIYNSTTDCYFIAYRIIGA